MRSGHSSRSMIPGDLWRAETAWWMRVAADGFTPCASH